MNSAAIDISVIIPCRNEDGHIQKTIRSVLSQKGMGESFSCEVIIVDGMSDDMTAYIVREEMKNNPLLKLVINDKRFTPAAFNIGIRNSVGSYICILGAHSEVNDDYLISCLETIRKVNADNVGGPWRVKGDGYLGKAIALAFQNPFSSGWAKGHNLNYEGYLDTVWGGFYKREMFDKIGLFDEELIRNQDDELNYRLIKSGGKIWQTPKIRYYYICRKNLKKLFLQYLQYGYWKVRVIQKHKLPASIRHLVPAWFVGISLILALMSLFSPLALKLLVCIAGLYGMVNLFFTFIICSKLILFKFIPVLPFVFAAYHLGYGCGFLLAMADILARGKNRGVFFSRITRG